MESLKDHRFLLSFYGDDFTGSADVMEALVLNGVPTALFLEAPTPVAVHGFQLKNHAGIPFSNGLQAFGVAGVSRSMDPAQMEEELPAIFQKISQIDSHFFHYKTCSTFDSSPETGNIGLAAEIALRYFPSPYIPLLVGAPSLNRFCVFGNLFARVGDITYRLDRHPTMSRHPVTPMRESDLRLHLGQQTQRPVRLFDLFALGKPLADRQSAFGEMAGQGAFLLLDVLDEAHLQTAGQLIWSNAPATCQLLIGSSGMEYALCKHLAASVGLSPLANMPKAEEVGQILVMAGSASPTTAQQLDFAQKAGFALTRLNTRELTDTESRQAEMARVMEEALEILGQGRSLAIFSAMGPEDPMIAATKQQLAETGRPVHAGLLVAQAQGELMKQLLEKSRMKRVVVAGGDTSGYVARALGISALEILAPIAPGSPLCTAHSAYPAFDGLEIALKGGQNGKPDYFEAVRKGRPLL